MFQTYYELSNISLRNDILIELHSTQSDVDFAIQASKWCGTLEHEKLHWKRQHAEYCWDIPFAAAYYAAISIAWLEYFVPKEKWPSLWLHYLTVIPSHPNLGDLIIETKTLVEHYREANERKIEPSSSYSEGFKLGAYTFYAFGANIFKASVFLELYAHAGGPDSSLILEPAKRPLAYVKAISDDPGYWIPQLITGWFGSHRTRDNAFWAYSKEILKSRLSIITSITSYAQEMLSGCNTNTKAPIFGDGMYWGLDHALYCYLFKKYGKLPLEEIVNVPPNQVMSFFKKRYPKEFFSWTDQRQQIINRFLNANNYTQDYACN